MLAIDLYSAHNTTSSHGIDYKRYDKPHVENIANTSTTSPIGYRCTFLIKKSETRPWQSPQETNYWFVNDQLFTVPCFDEIQPRQIERAIEAIPLQPITFIDRLNPIREMMALSITQMAELFGVTRKSIYDWYDGVEPRVATNTRIEILRKVLDEMSTEADLKHLKAVWNIPINGLSFRAILNNDELDSNSLLVELKKKLNELTPNLVKETRPLRKKSIRHRKSHLAEIEKHADFT